MLALPCIVRQAVVESVGTNYKNKTSSKGVRAIRAMSQTNCFLVFAPARLPDSVLAVYRVDLVRLGLVGCLKALGVEMAFCFCSEDPQNLVTPSLEPKVQVEKRFSGKGSLVILGNVTSH